MKNLKLSVRLGLLVAVMLATTLTVVIVGVRQLAMLDDNFAMLVDHTGRELMLANDAEVALLASIRAEKNAVLEYEKAPSIEAADVARAQFASLKAYLTELATLARARASAADENAALAELDRVLADFEKNQKEVLRLAVMKTTIEATAILHKDLFPRARELEEFIGSLADPAADAARAQAGQLLLGRMYDLLFHLGAHIDSDNEQQMVQMDAELRSRLGAYQDSLRRFSGLLDDGQRTRALSLLSSLDNLRTQVARIQELSHTNSGTYARILTTTRTIELADRAAQLFDDVRKTLTNRLKSEREDASLSAQIGRTVVITTGIVGALLCIVFAWVINRSITQPVQRGVQVFESLASGDLTQRLALDRRDEIGRLGAASDQMAEAMCAIVTQIRTVAGKLSGSAGELEKVSTDLLSQSHEMTTQAESVAAGTEQMSTNVSTMAAAAEQMSVNVSSISSASEEVSVNVGTIVQSAGATSRSVGSVAEAIARITGSLTDVARDAKHGSQLTQQARDMAAEATRSMRQLDQAASEITKVTEVIKSIALQTNLLALNATIEATSAGEAGKGFAVVASEVKELASQSAQSAEEIARKIDSVQTSTRDAVKVIQSVAQFVDQVNESAGRISQAVDGQTQTAGHIVSAVGEAKQGVESIARSIAEVGKGATDVSRNTSEAASAATDVSRNASEAAKAAETISSNIHGVSDATRLSTASATQLNESARQLSELASELQRAVSRFRVTDKGST